jgi:membrane-associated protease RseP (regulator of RpoE activity)
VSSVAILTPKHFWSQPMRRFIFRLAVAAVALTGSVAAAGPQPAQRPAAPRPATAAPRPAMTPQRPTAPAQRPLAPSPRPATPVARPTTPAPRPASPAVQHRPAPAPTVAHKPSPITPRPTVQRPTTTVQRPTTSGNRPAPVVKKPGSTGPTSKSNGPLVIGTKNKTPSSATNKSGPPKIQGLAGATGTKASGGKGNPATIAGKPAGTGPKILKVNPNQTAGAGTKKASPKTSGTKKPELHVEESSVTLKKPPAGKQTPGKNTGPSGGKEIAGKTRPPIKDGSGTTKPAGDGKPGTSKSIVIVVRPIVSPGLVGLIGPIGGPGLIDPGPGYPPAVAPLVEAPPAVVAPPVVSPSVVVSPTIVNSTVVSPPVVRAGGSDVDPDPPVEAKQFGLQVTFLAEGGGAARAGIAVGDILISIGGERVQSFDEMVAAVAKADGPVEAIVARAETLEAEKLVLVPVGGKCGVAVEPVEIQGDLPGGDDVEPDPVILHKRLGLQVTFVAEEGGAARAGIAVGDILLTIGGERVESFDEMVAAVTKAGGPVEVVVARAETLETEKVVVTPIAGRLGTAVEPIEIQTAE